ncbi:Isy1-like splicing factor [Lipomyces arxii]|uniref:Isy1-like splicing factor n=1 Tax=Lipomyces arxii TaxID=56418 RepID=UPI0034CF0627
MARNSEKAQSMLYRFREQEAAEMGIIDIGRARRPKLITSVESIPMCEKWRGQVVKEISRKVTKIQDPGLSDYEIRDLNDEINKMMREKYVWEIQIRNLGGPNYSRFAGRNFDDEGRELPTTRGYKYFGRARELPGVKELLAPAPVKDKTKKQVDYVTNVNADYYGYRDEVDPEVLKHELALEEISIGNTLKDNSEDPPESWETIERPESIPNRSELEAWLIERRKRKLMEKYDLESKTGE